MFFSPTLIQVHIKSFNLVVPTSIETAKKLENNKWIIRTK